MTIDRPRILVPDRRLHAPADFRRARYPRRHKPWCPRFRLDTLNAGNTAMVGTDDKVRVSTANGIMVGGATDSCCCGCKYLTGTTPAEWQVTISGVTACVCTLTKFEADVIFDPNGVWSVKNNFVGGYLASSPCAWEYKANFQLFQQRPSCGALGSVISGQVSFVLQATALGQWEFDVFQPEQGGVSFFASEQAGATDGSPFTLTNNFTQPQTACGSGPPGYDPALTTWVAYGGTADFTAVVPP